jgi:hypothetical protein
VRSQIVGLISSPLARTVIVLSGLLAVIDFSRNILIFRSQTDRDYRSSQLSDLRSMADESSATQAVAEWLGVVASQSQGSDELSLEGMLSESGRLRAIIRQGAGSPSNASRVVVGVGDQIAGWQVVEFSPNSVLIKRGDEERRLTLFRKDLGVARS